MFTNETITQRSGLKSRYETREPQRKKNDLSSEGREFVNYYINNSYSPGASSFKGTSLYFINIDFTRQKLRKKSRNWAKSRYKGKFSYKRRTAFGHKIIQKIRIPTTKTKYAIFAKNYK